MEIYNSYLGIIAICTIIILSYGFNLIAKHTNIPSVLLLIVLGFLIRQGLNIFGVEIGDVIYYILEILGIVGLIMIVLEATLELELSRKKLPLIIKSFFVALIALFLTSFLIAYLLNLFLIDDFYTSMVYAVPLAIMSSAIIIPSVGTLTEDKKEFMVYESTFSDILGIMLFYFIIQNVEASSISEVVINVAGNILVTVVLSVILSYILVLVLQRLGSQVKLVLLLSLLVLLYSVGKLFHFSSLFIILIFGLILNNHRVFFGGKLKKWLIEDRFKIILKEFHIVTLESAFFVRTFFFVIFGMTLNVADFADYRAALLSVGIIAIVFAIRYLVLNVFRRKNLMPELFIAPRGLITILLIFGIPEVFHFAGFSSAVLLYTVLLSTIIMAVILIKNKEGSEPIEDLTYYDWENVEFEIRNKTDQEKID